MSLQAEAPPSRLSLAFLRSRWVPNCRWMAARCRCCCCWSASASRGTRARAAENMPRVSSCATTCWGGRRGGGKNRRQESAACILKTFSKMQGNATRRERAAECEQLSACEAGQGRWAHPQDPTAAAPPPSLSPLPPGRSVASSQACAPAACPCAAAKTAPATLRPPPPPQHWVHTGAGPPVVGEKGREVDIHSQGQLFLPAGKAVFFHRYTPPSHSICLPPPQAAQVFPPSSSSAGVSPPPQAAQVFPPPPQAAQVFPPPAWKPTLRSASTTSTRPSVATSSSGPAATSSSAGCGSATTERGRRGSS